ncbi:3-oxoacyl-reductase [Dendryphion nanum]|uniref:3-oxoacyl-reductase n=1 Tax=Dendryphion nanum TaxID=256645 RepID=A0A9P9ILY5_9PLEO|nr:3-oxoacyl-reductase [Dendryphion nanum]
MTHPLSSKLITLTGAASGIGLSTALLLAQNGAFLSIADYNGPSLERAYATLCTITSAANILSTHLDIRDTSAVDNWISNTISHFGRPIDGCANVAGFHPTWAPKGTEEVSDEEFEEVMAINSTGLFKCLRAQIRPGVLNPEAASIVNVGSVSGLVGFAYDSAYVASKHAAHGLTKAVSKEVGGRNVRVNAVAPGTTDTPMVQAMRVGKGTLELPNVSLKRDGQPEEIAEAILWLLGSGSRYVTGSIYRVDGGMLE